MSDRRDVGVSRNGRVGVRVVRVGLGVRVRVRVRVRELEHSCRFFSWMKVLS